MQKRLLVTSILAATLQVQAADINLLTNGSFEQGANNFLFTNNHKNIALNDSMMDKWISREKNEDQLMDLANISHLVTGQDGSTSMLTQSKARRGLVQIVDVLQVDTTNQELAFSFKMASLGQNEGKEIGAYQVIGFNDFSDLTTDIGGKYVFDGKNYDTLVNKVTIKQSSSHDSAFTTYAAKATLSKDYNYFAVLLGGKAAGKNKDKKFTAFDDVYLGLTAPEAELAAAEQAAAEKAAAEKAAAEKAAAEQAAAEQAAAEKAAAEQAAAEQAASEQAAAEQAAAELAAAEQAAAEQAAAEQAAAELAATEQAAAEETESLPLLESFNLLVSGSFQKDTRNFLYTNNNGAIAFEEEMFGQWISKEKRDDTYNFEVWDLTNIREAKNVGRAENALLFHARNKRGFAQIIDARDIDTLNQQLSFGAKYFAPGHADRGEISGVQVIGFNKLSDVTASLNKTYQFNGEYDDVIAKQTIYGSDLVDNAVTIEDSVVLDRNYNYLAVVVGGFSESAGSYKEFVSVDDVLVAIHPVDQAFAEPNNDNEYTRVLDVTDEMIAAGREEFAKECAGCHVRKDGFDLAHFSFTDFDLNRRAMGHVNQVRTDTLVAFINSLSVDEVAENVAPFFPGRVETGEEFGEYLFGEDQWPADFTKEDVQAIDMRTVPLPFDLPLWSKEGINSDWMPSQPLHEMVLGEEGSDVRLALETYHADMTSDEAFNSLSNQLFQIVKSNTGPCTGSPNFDADICFDTLRWRAALAYQHDRALGMDGSRHAHTYWDVGFDGGWMIHASVINGRENWGPWLYLGIMLNPGHGLGTGYVGKGFEQRPFDHKRVGTFAMLQEMAHRSIPSHVAYRDLENVMTHGHVAWRLNAAHTAIDILEKQQAGAPTWYNEIAIGNMIVERKKMIERYGSEAAALTQRLQVLIDLMNANK